MKKQIEEMAKIKEYCGDCKAWSGTDCTRNPYTQGCLKEQIEEMAKDLYGHICGKAKCQECKYNGDSEILEPYCPDYLRAKHLIGKGYRKITKNVVVLTKEELNDIENKSYDTGFDNGAEIARKRAIKETAEKFAERLKEIEVKLDLTRTKYSQEDIMATANGLFEAFIQKVDEICKGITEASNETL